MFYAFMLPIGANFGWGYFAMWQWLSDPENQKTLAFLGGGVVAIAGGAWTVFKFLLKKSGQTANLRGSGTIVQTQGDRNKISL